MKRFAGLFFAVALVAALWSAGWFVVSAQVSTGLSDLALAEGSAERPRLSCARSAVTGFPFRIDVTCEEATVLAEDITVTLAGFKVSAQVDNPTHVLASAKGPITYADAFYGSSNRLDFVNLQASARLTTADLLKGLTGAGWRIARISVVGDGLDWVDTIGEDLPVAKASHAELQIGDIPELHDKVAGTAALAVYVVGRDVVAPIYNLVDADGEAQLQLSGLPDDLRRFAEPDLLPAWQAAGGRLEIIRVNATDGTDLIDATGSLGLDASRRLEGQVTYSNRGIRERLAPFVNAMILSVMSGLPEADGTFKQAVQFANGALLIGGIPLFQLEPLY